MTSPMFFEQPHKNSEGWVLGATCPNCERFAPACPELLDPIGPTEWIWRMRCQCGQYFSTRQTVVKYWNEMTPEEVGYFREVYVQFAVA